MPTARYDFGAATATNGKIYAIGGYTGSTRLATVEEYDPLTDVWTRRADMPTARNGIGVAAAPNGKVYAIGGYSSARLGTVEEYDPTTDTWAVRPSMPTPRSGFGLAVGSNGKIYAIGGADSAGVPVNIVEEFDPATGQWTRKANMPTPRFDLGVATGSSGTIYAIGGYRTATGQPGEGEQAVAEGYDPTSDYWRSLPSMPVPRWSPGVSVGLDGAVYAMGGRSSGAPTSSVSTYDPATNAWSSGSPMSVAREDLAAATAANGSIYAIGGQNYSLTPSVLGIVEEGSIRLEPNDSFAAAARVSPGFAVQETISSPADADFFSFWVDRGPASATVSLSDLPANYDLYVYAPDQTLIGSSTAPGTAAETVTASLSSGNHYVKVASGDGSASISPYTVRISLSMPPQPTPTPDPLGHWTRKSDMPLANARMAAVSSGDKVITLGGFLNSYGMRVGLTLEYDPATDYWASPLPDMLTARSDLAATVGQDGKVYAIGGSIDDVNKTGAFERYDPSARTWTALPLMTTPRSGLGAATVGGKIYAVGGSSAYGGTGAVEEWDTALGVWSTRAPMPTPRDNLGVAAGANGRIYAIGGTVNGQEVSAVEEYDPGSDSWRSRASLPEPMAYHGVALGSDGKIYSIGARRLVDHLEPIAYQYDPPADSWLAMPAMSVPREMLAVAIASNGKIYAVGGVDRNLELKTVEEFTLPYAPPAP